MTCPCGSAKAFSSCCEPFIAGAQEAPTAEALMRARYTAYTQHHIDFLLRTYAPDQQYLFDRETTLEWARRSRWLGLEIKSRDGGEPADDDGSVEFVAWYTRDGKKLRHHEVSQFKRFDNRWYYVEGRYPSSADLLGAESRRMRSDG